MKTRLLFVPLPTFYFRAKRASSSFFQGETHISKRPSFPPSLIPAVATRVFLTVSHFGGYKKKEKGKRKVLAKKKALTAFWQKNTHTFLSSFI